MFTFRAVFVGAALMAGALSSANAADVYARGESLKDGPAYLPPISWAGFYAGVHAGGIVSDNVERSVDFAGIVRDTDEAEIESTWLAGAHVGYNWQVSNIVLGVEGSISAVGGERDIDVDGVNDGEQNDNWLASIRGRLGYAFGPMLVYGTGGVAFLNSDDTEPFDDTVTGWVAGGGVEYKLSSNWSMGVEGLYYAFDDEATSPGLGGFNTDFAYDRDLWTVQARLTYHFGDLVDAPLK